MTEKELIQYLKDNLKLEVNSKGGYYEGDSVSHDIILKLGNVILSEVTIYT